MVFLDRTSKCCLLAHLMLFDKANFLAQMVSQSLKEIAVIGWKCVLKVMCSSLVFLELYFNDLESMICDARLNCLEIILMDARG